MYIYMGVESVNIGGQSPSCVHDTRTLKLMLFKYRKVHLQRVLGIMENEKLL